MIQMTSPPGARRKWLRMSGGRILGLPGSPRCRIPPRGSQMASRTNPPPAVTTHAMSAAHFIAASFPSSKNCSASLLAAPQIRNRRPAIAAECLRPETNARRRLAALVFGAVDQGERALHDVGIESVLGQLLARAVLLDVRLEHAVEGRVRRGRGLVE